MKKNKIVKVTTTSSLQGIEIEEYIGPVSISIVIGMNIFKDIFSQWRDVFGGKSNSYTKSLEQINQQAILELQKKASKFNANYIIGLTIENDEISSQGKSMIMVTALGTAVRTVSRLKESINNSKSIDLEVFERLELKNSLIRKAINEDLSLNDNTWKSIIDNEIAELSSFLLNEYMKHPKSIEFNEKILYFFESLPEESSKNELYKFLRSTPSENRKPIIEIIKKLNLVDLEKNLDFLESNDENLISIGTILSGVHKKVYSQTDIELLHKTLDIVTEKFPLKADLYESFSTMFNKNIQLWNCECGKENKGKDKICKNCNKDRYGYKTGEQSISRVIGSLETRIEVLEQHFNE